MFLINRNKKKDPPKFVKTEQEVTKPIAIGSSNRFLSLTYKTKQNKPKNSTSKAQRTKLYSESEKVIKTNLQDTE